MLIPIRLLATPAVTKVSGAVRHGATLAIAGAGFGEKAEPAPWIWDDFENGQEDAPLETSPTVKWIRYGSGEAEKFPQYRADGAYAGRLGAAKTIRYGPEWLNYGAMGLNAGEMYISFMFKWTLDDGNLDDGLVMKFCRLNSAPNCYHSRPSFAVNMRKAGNAYCNFTPDADGADYRFQSTCGTMTRGTWHRWETYWKLSTPGQRDGLIQLYLDHTEVAVDKFVNVMTRGAQCAEQLADNFLLPMMHARGRNAIITYRADNVYADRTRARVELADSATWASRTRSELQIPTAWAPDAVSVTVNLGMFSPDQTVYLYIVDSAGIVSTGYPLRVAAHTE